MSPERIPSCPRHGVQLRLSTLHSDSSAPAQLIALYECPECGYERRLPLALGPEAGSGAEVA